MFFRERPPPSELKSVSEVAAAVGCQSDGPAEGDLVVTSGRVAAPRALDYRILFFLVVCAAVARNDQLNVSQLRHVVALQIACKKYKSHICIGSLIVLS